MPKESLFRTRFKSQSNSQGMPWILTIKVNELPSHRKIQIALCTWVLNRNLSDLISWWRRTCVKKARKKLRRCLRSSWKKPRGSCGQQKFLRGTGRSGRTMQNRLDIPTMKMRDSKQCFKNSKRWKRNDQRVAYRGLTTILRARIRISPSINWRRRSREIRAVRQQQTRPPSFQVGLSQRNIQLVTRIAWSNFESWKSKLITRSEGKQKKANLSWRRSQMIL